MFKNGVVDQSKIKLTTNNGQNLANFNITYSKAWLNDYRGVMAGTPTNRNKTDDMYYTREVSVEIPGFGRS